MHALRRWTRRVDWYRVKILTLSGALFVLSWFVLEAWHRGLI